VGGGGGGKEEEQVVVVVVEEAKRDMGKWRAERQIDRSRVEKRNRERGKVSGTQGEGRERGRYKQKQSQMRGAKRRGGERDNQKRSQRPQDLFLFHLNICLFNPPIFRFLHSNSTDTLPNPPKGDLYFLFQILCT
jgi:hypothetical protein